MPSPFLRRLLLSLALLGLMSCTPPPSVEAPSTPVEEKGGSPEPQTEKAAASLQNDAPVDPLAGLKIARPEDRQDTPTIPPPANAIVLYDGKDLNGWVSTTNQGAPHWKQVEGGAIEVVKGGGIMTTRQFDGHFKLHVEFRVPYMPEATGQARGNSGVYLQGRYEVQVLDSYGLESKDDDCGGIYKVAVPKVNACKAPTVWQSYDIEFQAPRFQDGKKVENAWITVFQNGQQIHDHVEIPLDNTVAGLGGDPSQPGPIMLQDHNNPVQFRNIWLVPLDSATSSPASTDEDSNARSGA